MTEKFGIEIEFLGLGDQFRAATALEESGFQAYAEHYNHHTRAHWKIVDDGSVYDMNGSGAELVSPPLPYNVQSLQEVKLAILSLQDAGAYMNNRCGIHVHVDATFLRAFDYEKRQAFFDFLVEAYGNAEDTLHSLIKENRRNGYYCRSVKGKSYYDLEAERYHALNVCSYGTHGTIEFRALQGTLNEEAVSAWITVCVTFMQNVRKHFEASWTARTSLGHSLTA